MWSKLTVLLCGILLSFSSLAETLSGSVTDNGEPMSHAYVILYLGSGNVILDAKHTDQKGLYSFEISPGIYNLCVSMSDYAYNCESGIEIAGKNANIDFKMTPSAFEEKEEAAASSDCY